MVRGRVLSVSFRRRPLQCRSHQAALHLAAPAVAGCYGFSTSKGFCSTAIRSRERPLGATPDGVSESPHGRDTPNKHKAFSDVAFAFEYVCNLPHDIARIEILRRFCRSRLTAYSIDGVLYRGKEGIPGAKEMLQKIHERDMRYVFLTNGGGISEDAKAASLAKRLQLSGSEGIIKNRVIQSHTPMRGWDEDMKKNGTVLITSSQPEKARKLAIE